MSIINGLNNHVGVQNLDAQLDTFRGYQSHDIVRHPNGNLYAVWAQGAVNGIDQILIYSSMSVDNGLTWATPTQITSGNTWDTYPCIIVINTTSTTSDLGVMFVRNPNTSTSLTNALYRLTLSHVDASLSSSVDEVGSGSSFSTGFPVGVALWNLDNSGGSWAFCTRNPGSISISPTKNTSGFTLNDWVGASSQSITSTGNEMLYLRIKILANGDLCAVACCRTGLNGSVSGTSWTGIIRQDVFVAFSSNGTTWVNPTNLTGYSGTAAFTESGFTTAYHPDVVQLSDGSLTIVYQESLAQMLVASGTTPAESGSAFNNIFRYNSTNGQFYYFQLNTQLSVLDLPNQNVNHLNSSTTPNTWSNNLDNVAISSDNQYLAIGTSDGGISIYDTTADFPVSGWTTYQFRTGSAQALLSNDVNNLYWLPGTHKLLIATATLNGLQLLDMTTPASPTISTVAPSGASGPWLAGPTNAGSLILEDANFMYAIDSTSMSFKYKIALTGSSPGTTTGRQIFIDDINNEILYLGTNTNPTTLSIYNEIGGVFNLNRSYNTTSSPNIPKNASMQKVGTSCVYIYGEGNASNDTSIHLYSFVARSPIGMISMTGDFTYGDWTLGTSQYPMKTFNFGGSNWYCMNRTVAAPIIAPCDTAGRLRVANYPYNGTTHAVNTSGVNIYDAVNSAKIGTQFNRLRIPHITASVDDTIVMLTKYFDPFNTTSDPLVMYIARIAPSSAQFKCKARIKVDEVNQLQCKARISVHNNRTFTCRAHISHSSQLAMRANIIPRTNKTMTCKANIRGMKSVTLDCTFLASPETAAILLVQYVAGSASYTPQGLSMGARIVKQQQAIMTATYSGAAVKTPSMTSSFTSILGGRLTFNAKARIVSP
jgi:hypothetical protein